MRTIKTYNNTDKTYGIYNTENLSVDSVFNTEEEAREEIENLKLAGDGDNYEIVRVEPRTTTPAQARAAAKYDKTNTKGVYLKFNKTTDADILEHLKSVENVQGYIKNLIRNDLHK
jgi:hypothetical protein